MWQETQLNVRGTDSDQENPDVLYLEDGTFVAVWSDYTLDDDDLGVFIGGSQGVRLSVWNPAGEQILQEWRVNDIASGFQGGPYLARAGDGFVVAFRGDGEDLNGVDDPYMDGFFQLFDGDGKQIGDNVQITEVSTEDNRIQDVVTLADGSYVIVLVRSDVRTDWDIEVHRFTADGARLGGPVIIQDEADTGLAFAGRVATPSTSLTPLADGGYMMTWWQDPDDGAYPDHYFSVLARSYDADGTPRGPVQVLNGPTDDFERNRYPTVVELGADRFLVAWQYDGNDVAPDAYRGRIVNADAVPLTPIVTLGTGESLWSIEDVIPLIDGFALAVWADPREGVGAFYQDFFDVALRLIGPDGSQVGRDYYVNSRFYYEDIFVSKLALGPDGELTVVWEGEGTDDLEVFASQLPIGEVLAWILGVDDPVIPGDGTLEALLPDPEPDPDQRIMGTKGGETLTGGTGDDILIGRGGADTMIGDAGADIFVLMGRAPDVTIVDWEEGDQIAIDDQLLGLGTRKVDVRDLTGATARELLREGIVGYSKKRGELSIDIDGDGTREVVADLGSDVRLGLDDVLLF